MYHVFIDVGSPSVSGVPSPKGDKRVCNNNEECAIYLQECLFSLIGFYLSFNDFEASIVNYIDTSLSQLHLMS